MRGKREAGKRAGESWDSHQIRPTWGTGTEKSGSPLTLSANPCFTTCLLLQLLLGEHGELVAEDLLRVEDLLVVHLLDERVVLDAVRLQELHVRHLERLPDRLRDELRLRKRECSVSWSFPCKVQTEAQLLMPIEEHFAKSCYRSSLQPSSRGDPGEGEESSNANLCPGFLVNNINYEKAK